MSLTSDQKGPAVLKVPGPNGQGPKRTIECELQGMQGKRLAISAAEGVRESTLVSIEYEDTLFLGEVVVCSASEQTWKLEVRIEQMLNGLQSLMTLRAHLLSESLTAPLPLMPVGMRN